MNEEGDKKSGKSPQKIQENENSMEDMEGDGDNTIEKREKQMKELNM